MTLWYLACLNDDSKILPFLGRNSLSLDGASPMVKMSARKITNSYWCKFQEFPLKNGM